MTLSNVENVTADHVRARQQWVELLRSGEYAQLKNALSSADGKNRCCLGVACDVRVSGIEFETTSTLDGYLYFKDVISEGDGNQWEDAVAASLPETAMRSLGFYTCSPIVTFEGKRENLSWLNDHGHSFEEIADLIEQQYVEPHLHLLEDEDAL